MKTYTIKEIASDREWNEFFNRCGSPSFLQSLEWGEVQKRHGYTILRLGVYRDGLLIALAQTILIRAKRGNMIFLPHGPITENMTASERNDTIAALCDYLTALARQDGYHFIRIAPVWEDSPEGRAVFAKLGFRTSPIYMHAERVWMLDLGKSEEELLKDMRKTTRYSIRKAEKDGARIVRETDLDRFWKIYQQTAERENFTPFSKELIGQEYEEFRRTGRELFISGLLPDGSCAASALFTLTQSTAFYHQGATTHSKVPVSYLLQWHAIREAKKRGCRYYSFWGILQPGRTPKNWGGLSLFKQGFGGFQRDYIPTQDFIISPLRYAVSYAYETYLKFRRGV